MTVARSRRSKAAIAHSREIIGSMMYRRNEKCEDTGPQPCFYFPECHAVAELEKCGKAVCSRCAAALNGREYPLRTARQHKELPSVSELVWRMGLSDRLSRSTSSTYGGHES